MTSVARQHAVPVPTTLNSIARPRELHTLAMATTPVTQRAVTSRTLFEPRRRCFRFRARPPTRWRWRTSAALPRGDRAAESHSQPQAGAPNFLAAAQHLTADTPLPTDPQAWRRSPRPGACTSQAPWCRTRHPDGPRLQRANYASSGRRSLAGLAAHGRRACQRGAHSASARRSLLARRVDILSFGGVQNGLRGKPSCSSIPRSPRNSNGG